ncbi:MAG: hypothetical protein ACFFDV_07240 [Candidatus Thorarchaeota archaeon]
MTLELKDKFIEATSKYQDRTASEDNTILLHRTPWVRILLEPNRDESCSFCIDVEVSLPKNQRGEEMDSTGIIVKLNEHLQYLEKLGKHGFELCLIKSGCIWCASKTIRDTPKDNLFRALIPP